MKAKVKAVDGAERKRLWRLQHRVESREYERKRAQARRRGWWFKADNTACLCKSSASYIRYEQSDARERQRHLYPRYGAGAHRLTKKEFKALHRAMCAAIQKRIDAIRAWAPKVSLDGMGAREVAALI